MARLSGSGRSPYDSGFELRRGAGALLISVLSLGTSLVFLGAAWLFANLNCEDGCAPGSRWASGAWGSTVELWGLAVPAVFAAVALVWAVVAGWRSVAMVAWVAMTGLLVAWCVFIGATSVPIDLSGTSSHWLWLAGLLACSGGGLLGLMIAFLRLRS